MLYSEIIAVCSQIHTKHINTLCGQNVELLNVKPGGIVSVGSCHYGMARLQAADGGQAPSDSGQLRIYFKSSHKEPTSVSLPAWDLCDVLVTPVFKGSTKCYVFPDLDRHCGTTYKQKSTCESENNIKIGLELICWRRGQDWCGSGQENVAGFCRHGYEPPDSTKCGEFLDMVSKCYLFDVSASWS